MNPQIRRNIHILALLMPALLMASACSEYPEPDSPEPVLEIGEATDITRNEATVKAKIDCHGGASLSYVALHYMALSDSADEELLIDADPFRSDFEFHLTGLRPGAAYACRLEAGTPSASLKSNTISFSTIPNEAPKLSPIMPLATGPIGIIVEFRITDDGGEPVAEAGCEIKEVGTTESRRIYAVELNPLSDDIRISITGLSPSTSYSITPFASNAEGEARGETFEYTTKEAVVLIEAGMLSSLFGNNVDLGKENITIAGPMNGDDFHTLRSWLGAPSDLQPTLRISDIDLSDVEIAEGGASFDGQHFTEPNRLTTGLLADCILLRHALLPNTAVAMERDVFARCRALEVITVPASLKSLLPSSGCTALRSIEVSAANPDFTSVDGVLLNGEASRILWFPCGKTGDFTIPSSVTSIGEAAFAGTNITTLHIPESVTSISRGAFAGSSLSIISLPDKLSNIPEGTFQNCASLTELRLGAGTQYIGDFAFDGTALSDIYLTAQHPPFCAPDALSDRFRSLIDECVLHIPQGSLQLYRNHPVWCTFKKIEEFETYGK